MENNKTICFTGGGTAGHVTVNLSLIPMFQKQGFKIIYIGSKNGIEKELISKINNVKYYEISTGKLRRYFDLQNVIDIFNVLKGCIQAINIIKKNTPSAVFSKGGFVSLPAVYAGHFNKVPVIIHESDLSPGLTNKLSKKYANVICTTFEETEKFLNTDSKVEFIGPIIRSDLINARKEIGEKFINFTNKKPVLLVMGGSSGAGDINLSIREQLNEITKSFNIIHLCGKGNFDKNIDDNSYKQFEYLNEELPHILKYSDIVISRAGANSIFELLYLKKPMILVPLPANRSRGDQILNANNFKKKDYCEIIENDKLNTTNLHEFISKMYANKDQYVIAMKDACDGNGINKLYDIITTVI